MTDDLNTNEIMDKFNAELGKGQEVNRELFNLKDIEARSNITAEQRLLITQLRFIADLYELPIIERLIIKPYLVLGLSVDGLARNQLTDTLKSPIDYIKGMLSPQNNQLEPLGNKNRKL